MESLSLFNNAEAETTDNRPHLVPRESLDQDLLHTLESVSPNPKTVQSEIKFLNQYIERFNFEKDHQRLKTLEYYQTQIEG